MSQDYLDKLIEKDKAGTQIQSIPLHDTELRGITIDDPITVEGNPINFSTKNEQNAISSIIDINPIQDLHGYSKPWVGGAGKNVLKMTVDGLKEANQNSATSWSGNVFTNRDVKFTVITDTDNNVIAIKYECTSTTAEQRLMLLDSFTGISGDFIISGGVFNDVYVTYRIDGTWSSKYSRGPSHESSGTISSASSIVQGCVSVGANQTGSGYFYPMLRKSTDPAGFEPYSNICPIYPHEEIKIGGCGKNLIYPDTFVQGLLDATSGEVTVNTAWITSDYIEAQGTVTIQGWKDGTEVNFCVRFCEYASDKSLIKNTSNINTTDITTYSRTITLDSNTRYVRATFGFNNKTTTVSAFFATNRLMLELSSIVTSYESYQESNSLTLPLPENVYGGTLNLESGELRVENKCIDLGDLTWEVRESVTVRANLPTYAAFVSQGTKVNAVCSNYEIAPQSNITQYSACLTFNSNIQIYVRDTTTSFTSASVAKEYLTGVKLVYELTDSAKYTLKLTPAQLKLFKDVNNLNSSDYTTLTVTYHSNSIATLTPATDTTDGLLSAIDKRALDRTEEIVEGNPIAFKTESAQVAKSTIVDLEPIQDLHGYDKPWVGGAGKNLLPLTVDGIKSSNPSATWTGNSTVINGVTFTILTDSDGNVTGINANGTATGGNSRLYFPTMVVSQESQFNGCASGGSGSTYRLEAYNNTEAVWIAQYGDSVTLSVGNYSAIAILVYNGVNTSNKVFQPMVRLSTESDATFQPYTNECSISGRSEIGILGCGKNLYNKDITFCSNTWTNVTVRPGYVKFTALQTATYIIGLGGQGGTSKASASSLAKMVVIEENTEYTFSGYINGQGAKSLYIQAYDKDGNSLAINGNAHWLNPKRYYITFISPKNSAYLVLNIDSLALETNKEYELWYNLELGNQVSYYTPYTKSTDLTINLGQTVYGGTLDIENGVLVVTKKILDMSTLSWTTSSQNRWNGGVLSDSKLYTNQEVCDAITEGYVAVSASELYSNSHLIAFAITSDKTLMLRNESESEPTGNICYELATPTTISLTPEQIKLLQGVNTITTNADNITLTYRNGSVATLNDLESLYAKLKAYIDSLHSS